MDFKSSFMKKLVITVACIIATLLSHAQNFEQWFRQKQTEIKYLAEQIAALKAYGEVLSKGYDIAHRGLTDIFSAKEKDYRQHDSYFNSLWKVKSGIKRYSKVALTLEMKSLIEGSYRKLRSWPSDLLNDSEWDYINRVFKNLLRGSEDLTDELSMVVSNGQVQLKDDERLRRIDSIYSQMQDRYQFSQSFLSQIKVLIADWLKENGELQKLSSLYGLR